MSLYTLSSGETPRGYFSGVVLPKSLGDSVFVFWQIWPKKASIRTGTSQVYDIYIHIYLYMYVLRLKKTLKTFLQRFF